MYKIYNKYFGEFVDSITGYEKENPYEVADETIYDSLDKAKENFENMLVGTDLLIDEESIINTDKEKFYNDLERNNKNCVILFEGYQENWNCYTEIWIEKINNGEGE